MKKKFGKKLKYLILIFILQLTACGSFGFADGIINNWILQGEDKSEADSSFENPMNKNMKTLKIDGKCIGCYLADADFSKQTLIDKDFSHSNLVSARFIGSNLRGSSFYGANLKGVDFRNADLTNVNLEQVKNLENLPSSAKVCHTILPKGDVSRRDC